MRFASWSFAVVGLLALTAVAFAALQRRHAAADAVPDQIIVATAADGNAVHRLQGKDVVIRQVVAGELTLREAAGRFRDLNRAMAPVGLRRVPGEEDMPEGEWYCRQVLRWVQSKAAEDSAGPTAAVSRRLEAELNVALQSGPMELPANP